MVSKVRFGFKKFVDNLGKQVNYLLFTIYQSAYITN